MRSFSLFNSDSGKRRIEQHVGRERDPLRSVVAQSGCGERRGFRTPRRLRRDRRPQLLHVFSDLFARTRGGAFAQHGCGDVGESGQIGGIVQRARAQNAEPRGDQWQPMVFQHQHRQSIGKRHLDRLRKFDAQDVARDGRFVHALHFAERDRPWSRSRGTCANRTAETANGATRLKVIFIGCSYWAGHVSDASVFGFGSVVTTVRFSWVR